MEKTAKSERNSARKCFRMSFYLFIFVFTICILMAWQDEKEGQAHNKSVLIKFCSSPFPFLITEFTFLCPFICKCALKMQSKFFI